MTAPGSVFGNLRLVKSENLIVLKICGTSRTVTVDNSLFKKGSLLKTSQVQGTWCLLIFDFQYYLTNCWLDRASTMKFTRGITSKETFFNRTEKKKSSDAADLSNFQCAANSTQCDYYELLIKSATRLHVKCRGIKTSHPHQWWLRQMYTVWSSDHGRMTGREQPTYHKSRLSWWDQVISHLYSCRHYFSCL